MLKKHISINLLLLFFQFSLFSQTIITRPGIGDCKLVFEDNFNGNTLDESVWDYRTDVRFWSKQLPENVKVADGYLYLNVKKQKIGASEYTGAGIITKKGYRYGYYESRFKIPQGQGWHTSFWTMYRTPSTGVSYSKLYQEIDICENDSKNKTYYSTNLHNYDPTHTNSGGQRVTTPNLAETFHTWGCEFTPTVIKFFFEGKLVRTLDATKQKYGDASIWLTTIAASLGGTQFVDSTKLPSAAIFDYVRFYELVNVVNTDTNATDTMRITPDAANEQIIVDNTDNNCTFSAAWSASTAIPGFYGSDYSYFSKASSTDWAEWTPVIAEEGNYRVYMRWAAYSNRPIAAPVEINHMEGISTTKVNQTLNGGIWNFLGTFQLNKGDFNSVKIQCSSGINTIADAVLFEKMPTETALQNINSDNAQFWINATSDTNSMRATFELAKNSIASLKIHSIYGVLVNEVFSNKSVIIGKSNFDFNTVGMAKGIYLAVLTLDNKVLTNKFRFL